MAAKNFPKIMEHIFRYEGGYVNHPSDPGGATNMGITIGTLRSYRGGTVTVADVKALKKLEAMEIYRRNYWDKVSGDELPSGVDLCVMDSAVNSGPRRGAEWLQRAVNVPADGQIGPKTLSAAETSNAKTTINRMCDDRLAFLKRLSTWKTFGKGWASRVASVRALALDLAESNTETSVISDIAEPTPEEPVTATPSPTTATPVEQASKTVGSSKGSLQGSLLSGAIITLLLAFGVLPPELNTAEVGAAIGVVLTAISSGVLAAIQTYRAPPNAS